MQQLSSLSLDRHWDPFCRRPRFLSLRLAHLGSCRSASITGGILWGLEVPQELDLDLDLDLYLDLGSEWG
jgi:hypothetical protein